MLRDIFGIHPGEHNKKKKTDEFDMIFNFKVSLWSFQLYIGKGSYELGSMQPLASLELGTSWHSPPYFILAFVIV